MSDNEMPGWLLAGRLNGFHEWVVMRLALRSRQVKDAIEVLADVVHTDGEHHKQWGIVQALRCLGSEIEVEDEGVAP